MRYLLLSILACLVGATLGAAPESKADREVREKLDREVLASMRKNGADLTKPHSLEHHFYFRTEKAAESLSREAKADGYEISELKKAEAKDGARYFYFDLIKPVVPQEKAIFSETEKMTVWAKRYGGEYDGWGCEIVK